MSLIYSSLVFGVWFLATYINVVLILILLTKRKDLYQSPKEHATPFVSIIVPAYNEGKTLRESIHSLQALDYPKDRYEVIIVNDGSNDETADVARSLMGDNVRFLDNVENKGKAACLNQGIEEANGEIIACMDADSQVDADVLQKTMPHFQEEKTGAVTIRVDANNPKNLLQKVVEVEYVIGLTLSMRALSYFNSVFVTPGPFSLYRKKLLMQIGKFDPNSMTEDYEIAYRIQKSGYKIATCINTRVRTEVPPTFSGLFVQRRRWYTGALHTITKHRDILFNKKVGPFGFVMPYLFGLLFMGLILVGTSIYLISSNLYQAYTQFALTNFNFFSYLNSYQFDVLAVSSLAFFSIATVITTFMLITVSMKLAKTSISNRKRGYVGFFFLFFVYQLYWAVSLWSALFGRKVRWR